MAPPKTQMKKIEDQITSQPHNRVLYQIYYSVNNHVCDQTISPIYTMIYSTVLNKISIQTKQHVKNQLVNQLRRKDQVQILNE